MTVFARPQTLASGLQTEAVSLSERFASVRHATEELCAGLTAEDCQLQSMPDASPVKWHLAHTTWFFETFVLANQRGYKPFRPEFTFLYNSYYNTVGPMHARAQRGQLSRPTLAEIQEYRAHVDRRMEQAIESDGLLDPAAHEALAIGLHHEQQHQELILTDIKHAFSINPTRPVFHPMGRTREAEPCPLIWIESEGGLHEFGHAGGGFAYDNEGPRHRAYLAPFALASRPIVNAEFMVFMEEDGYRRPELWLSDGWAAVKANGWEAPMYWERGEGSDWQQFTLGGMRDVDPDEPVTHISLYEADAFATWAGGRLPTEYEWEFGAAGEPVAGNFAESGRFHPRAAVCGAAERERDAAHGVHFHQFFGDVWEWTRSAYAPYPGYKAAEGALGEYNGKFMCSQTVLRGGSCATPQSHMRPTYRNFFPAGARWQFSGIRLAKDL